MASASSNKSKPLDWSKRARADLDRIYDYYLDAAPYDVAEKAVREVLQQGKRIAEQAMVYRAGPKGTRECVMRRFPFILMMAAVALWFMSMDLALWFTRSPLAYGEFDTRRAVSMWFGLALMLAAWIADLRRKDSPDMTFWIHITAAAAFWGGLSLHDGGTQLDKFLYCLLNVALLAYSLFIDRRIYAVFGALGIAGYLGYLASDVFQDTIVFSFALSAIGMAVIAVGLFTHKNRPRLKAWFDSALPSGLRSLRPRPVP